MARTKVSNGGTVTEGGLVDWAVGMEAMSKVRHHRLVAQYGGKRGDAVAVFRPGDLTAVQRARVVQAAEASVARTDGYLKIVAHFLDWFQQGACVFWRLARMDRRITG